MAKTLLVGIGGFLGTLLRYGLSGLAHRCFPTTFPIGTLLVNVVGCLAVGAVWSLVIHRGWLGPDARTFLTVGILGGFTTFSAFGYETFQLLLERRYLSAGGNVAANVVLGILAVIVGWLAAKSFVA
jgi:CrcB protein